MLLAGTRLSATSCCPTPSCSSRTGRGSPPLLIAPLTPAREHVVRGVGAHEDDARARHDARTARGRAAVQRRRALQLLIFCAVLVATKFCDLSATRASVRLNVTLCQRDLDF